MFLGLRGIFSLKLRNIAQSKTVSAVTLVIIGIVLCNWNQVVGNFEGYLNVDKKFKQFKKIKKIKFKKI